MFAFTGLKTEQVEELEHKHNIFMTRDGRISLAGLNNYNLDQVSDKFH